jgi:hypothetical protein
MLGAAGLDHDHAGGAQPRGANSRARNGLAAWLSAGAGATEQPDEEVIPMQYAILCYNDEEITCAWSQEQDAAVMAKLAVVHEKLARQGKLGPVARLLPTTAATTVRKDREPALVIDGPFAETKEQLLGFYVVDCADLEEVLDIARELGQANWGGAYEIRPVGLLRPGKMAGE